MKKTIKGALCATVAFVLGAGAAWADGTYNLYSIGEAIPLGQIEIQDDVVIDGTSYASWSFPTKKLTLYIPPEAAYVTMDANSPIIGRPFEGGWVAEGTPEELGSHVCSETRKDHTGEDRHLWGDLVWTVTSLADDYEFEISLGMCGGPVQPWAQSVNAKG